MTTVDFTNVDELWKWLQYRSLTKFRFLIDDYGFEIAKNEIAPTQFSLEYENGGTRIGLWSSYGSRPEVFIESGGKKVFTNQLISQHARRQKLPVESAVFGERTIKDDYRRMLMSYVELIKACLDAEAAILLR